MASGLKRDPLVSAVFLVLVSLSAQYLSALTRISFEPSFIYSSFGQDGSVKASKHTETSRGRNVPIPESLGTIRNFSVGDRIYFGGQPSADDLALLQKRGVSTVVNLRGQDEMDALGFDERRAVIKLGMGYIHLPLTKGSVLSDEEINRILDVVGDTGKAPIILHCASSNRSGYIWAMYRALRGHVETNEAIRQGEAAGLRSDILKQRARVFISRNRR